MSRLRALAESILGLVAVAFALLLAFGFGCGLIYHILLLFGAKAGMLIPRLLSTYGGYATLVGIIGVGSIMLTIGFYEIIVVIRKLATRKTDREIFSDSFLEEL
jgi:hypothetical protein